MIHYFEETWNPRNAPTPKLVPFLTPDDYLAAALKAYLAACRDLIPPKDQHWLQRVDEGRFVSWAGPEEFYQALHRQLDGRVRAHAIKRGDLIRRFYSPAELAEEAARQADLAPYVDALMNRSQEADRCVAAGGKDGDE